MADNPLYEDIYRSFQTDIVFGRRSPRAIAQDARTAGPRPGGLSVKQKAQLARIASGTPQVMVKIISRSFNAASLKRTTDYISRDGDLEIETRDGVIDAGDRESLDDIRDDWKEAYSRRDGDGRSAKASLSIHIQLSMPAGTDRASFKEAAREFVEREIGPTNDYIMTFHDDTAHPHAHVVVQTRGDDGRHLRTDKETLDRWRESLAEMLRDRGIDADASPRHARGVDRRPQRKPEYHHARKNKLTQNERAHFVDVHQETLGQRQPRSQPWRQHMEERRQLVVATYQYAAEDLALSPDAADRQLAAQVYRFAEKLGPVKTRDDFYRDKIAALIAEKSQQRPTERGPQHIEQEQAWLTENLPKEGRDHMPKRVNDLDELRELQEKLNKSADKDIER